MTLRGAVRGSSLWHECGVGTITQWPGSDRADGEGPSDTDLPLHPPHPITVTLGARPVTRAFGDTDIPGHGDMKRKRQDTMDVGR